MDQIVPDDRSKYEDLTLFSVSVVVSDDVIELYGVVDSESDDNETERDQALENYLTQTNYNVSSQSMARTKQTARNSDKKGQIPSQSSSGHTLATFPNHQSPRFLDSDSDLERAANMFGVKKLRSRQKSPARGSPARGSKCPATPSSSDSGASPRKSPRLSSLTRGTPARRGATLGVGRSIPVGTVNPQQRKPGQAGFVQRGGSGTRGASRSSPRLALPSFSMEEDDDDDEEEEVDFPNQAAGQSQRQTVQTGKQPCKPIAVKNLNLIHAPKRGKSGFAEIARWNHSARQGAHNETKRGWMARRVGDPAQRQHLRRRRRGSHALQEIRFYQKSTCFLISMRGFQ